MSREESKEDVFLELLIQARKERIDDDPGPYIKWIKEQLT